LAWKKGEASTTSIATLRVRPAKSTRILQLKLDANDAVGNDASFTKTFRLKESSYPSRAAEGTEKAAAS
jgi:hypothetical protein